MSTAAIILAAGYSRRMGMFKPLLRLGGQTVIARAVSLFRQAGLADIRVVAGYAHELLEPVLKELEVRTILNPGYDAGMFSSVTAGLESLEQDVRAVLILPADIPLVGHTTVRCLMERHVEEPDKILIPCFGGRRGHPVVIPAMFFSAIRAWPGENGLKGAIAKLGHGTALVPVPDPNILFDLDTPDDYEEALIRCAGNPEWNGTSRSEVQGV